MESNDPRPDEAASLLAGADAAQADWVASLTLPSLFYASIGLAITAQIATAAVGIAQNDTQGLYVVATGLLAFALVAGVQLVRFRRIDGVWLATFASRVVLGSASVASTVYMLAFGAATWAAFEHQWGWLGLGATVGGLAYALSAQRWWRHYRDDPAAHAQGASVGSMIVVVAVAVVGLVLLLVGR